jgi:hypothetical protein
MAVNSVSSSNIDLTASYGVKSQQEINEVQQATRDVTPDNDSDDQAKKSAQSSVNTSGQTVGTIINTKA